MVVGGASLLALGGGGKVNIGRVEGDDAAIRLAHGGLIDWHLRGRGRLALNNDLCV